MIIVKQLHYREKSQITVYGTSETLLLLFSPSQAIPEIDRDTSDFVEILPVCFHGNPSNTFREMVLNILLSRK